MADLAGAGFRAASSPSSPSNGSASMGGARFDRRFLGSALFGGSSSGSSNGLCSIGAFGMIVAVVDC